MFLSPHYCKYAVGWCVLCYLITWLFFSGSNQLRLEAHKTSGSVGLGTSHPVTGTKDGIAGCLGETTHGNCSQPIHSFDGWYFILIGVFANVIVVYWLFS